MAKQTSVEWLVEQLPQIDWDDPFYVGLLQEAKAMEKEQIINAFYDSELHNTGNENDGEIYYNYIYDRATDTN